MDRDYYISLLTRLASAARGNRGIVLEASTVRYLNSFLDAVTSELTRLRGKEEEVNSEGSQDS